MISYKVSDKVRKPGVRIQNIIILTNSEVSIVLEENYPVSKLEDTTNYLSNQSFEV